MYVYFNTINAGDDSSIFCGEICGISTVNTQSGVTIYSEDVMYGEILKCDTDNCFSDSEINCNSTTCDIEFTEDKYLCDQCLNLLFTQYGLFSVLFLHPGTQQNTNMYKM